MNCINLGYYTSRLEINLDKIGSNLDKIRAYTNGLELMPVIKSNAYGCGTVAVANYLIDECGIRAIATARILEACQIQNAGHRNCNILILGPVPEVSIPIAVARNLQIPLFRIDTVRQLSAEAKRQGKVFVKAHIKVETGMNRIGVRPGIELQELLECIRQCDNVIVDGVFTHFATADQANYGNGNNFTREQFNLFCTALAQIRREGINPRFVHCCNTGATCWLKEAYQICSHVRIGSLYLGYSSIQNDWNPVDVQESASWKTTILNLRKIQKGESVGYGRFFKPSRQTIVATIPVGYGDGYLRSFALNGAKALVNGIRCNFVGTCMDMSFLDVTDVQCKIGDEVTLFGEDNFGNRISGLEIGHMMGETRLAMFSHISERVARVYINSQPEK